MPTIQPCIEIYQSPWKSKSYLNILRSKQIFFVCRNFSKTKISFRFQPQDIVLETKLKPFNPEYIPAIGDIDAFLKVCSIKLK